MPELNVGTYKCNTCKHGKALLEPENSDYCAKCVGFQRYEPATEGAAVDFGNTFGWPQNSRTHLTASWAPPGISKDPVLKPTNTWLKFLPVVQAIAGLSKDPSTKVGAIALDDNRNIVAVGYNGFPRGVNDDHARYADRSTKYKLIAHAEQNVVAQAAYSGRSLAGTTVILSALYPCSACAKSLIQAGVKRVISPMPNADPRWEEEAKWAQLMFEEAGVEVWHY